MKKLTALCVAILTLIGRLAASETLTEQFENPPPSARPWVYGFWLNGNVTKEGVTADLEAMKRVGIGGMTLMWGSGLGATVKDPVKFLSLEYWDILKHTIREADRLGLKINLTNGSGWSHSGGPWVTRDHSMQRLLQPEELRVEGRRRVELSIPGTISRVGGDLCGVDPAPNIIKTLRIEYQIKGQSHVAEAEDGKSIVLPNRQVAIHKAIYGPKDDASKQVDVTLSVKKNIGSGAKLASVVAYPVHLAGILESQSAIPLMDKVSDDGRCIWDAPPGNWRVLVFRHDSTGDSPHPVAADAGGYECDKLDPESVEQNWNGFAKRVLDECGPEARRVVKWVHVDSYEFQGQTWTPEFRKQFKKRRGYDPLPYLPILLGKTVDSPETARRFLWDFNRVRADLFAENIGGHMRDLCRREQVALTTQPHMSPVFEQVQYGGHASEPMGNFLDKRDYPHYAPIPPIGPEIQLAKGEVSAAYTYGLNGVIWAEAFTGIDHAHAWKETPEFLKNFGDLWLAEGINHFCFHCWAHSPSLTQKPGNTLGPWGIHFDRRNTWFELSTGYLSYLSRCQFVLQHGLPVVDVAAFTGDGVADVMTQHPELRAGGYDYHGVSREVLLNPETCVQDGRLVLAAPSKMRYQLLISYHREMTVESIRKLKQLVADGAVLMGTKPQDAPGLAGYPASGEEVRRIADELWGTDESVGRQGKSYGHGKVFWKTPGKPVAWGENGNYVMTAYYKDSGSERDVLGALGVAPDFEYGRSGQEAGAKMLAYQHRQMDGTDLYFVSNQAMAARQERCVFRVAGRQPELWDPVTGEQRDLPVFHEKNGRIVVPLTFAPSQSFIVVFRKDAKRSEAPTAKGMDNFPAMKPALEITGPWEVAFDSKWGGPERVTFEKLEDWSKHSDLGIKYYSGAATYRKVFSFQFSVVSHRIYLNLGSVKDLASVRLNGKELGVVWCAPWQIEVTGALHDGENTLELTVANEWVNRLIGDSALPQDKRLTWTAHNPYRPDSLLLESGLIGPVRLLRN